MVTARILCLTLLVVVPFVVAQEDTTPFPITTLTTTPSPSPPSPTRSVPGYDWSMSAEQLDFVNRRIRSEEQERPLTTTLPTPDYEEKPDFVNREPDEHSAVSGEHLPVGRHTSRHTTSQEVLDASYPARRRRQVAIRPRRQSPQAPAGRPIQSQTQGSGSGKGKGQGEYHGTALGAVFIKPKPKPTGAPVQLAIRRT